MWEWQNDDGSWALYDSKTAKGLERAHKGQKPGWSDTKYGYDLVRAVQINKKTKHERNLRRFDPDPRTTGTPSPSVMNRRTKPRRTFTPSPVPDASPILPTAGGPASFSSHAAAPPSFATPAPRTRGGPPPSSSTSKASSSARSPNNANQFSSYFTIAAFHEVQKDSCPICMCDFVEGESDPPVHLVKCVPHFFHKSCIEQCASGGGSSVRCPVCRTVYGVHTGDQPAGTMDVQKHAPGDLPLEGYEDVGTFQISYNFPSGTQGPEHQSPGQHYSGTNRTAYLPNTAEGRKVLALLRVGFLRRLLFTVGTSVTTGSTNTTVWNGVHHKTAPDGGFSNFGYPDETYLERVTAELAAKGVEWEDDMQEISYPFRESVPSQNDSSSTAHNGGFS